MVGAQEQFLFGCVHLEVVRTLQKTLNRLKGSGSELGENRVSIDRAIFNDEVLSRGYVLAINPKFLLHVGLSMIGIENDHSRLGVTEKRLQLRYGLRGGRRPGDIRDAFVRGATFPKFEIDRDNTTVPDQIQ